MASNILSELGMGIGRAISTNGNALSVMTGVKFTTSLLRKANGITFLYDPTWNWNNTDVPTLPIAFFYVKGCVETSESKVTTKPMIFFDSKTDTVQNEGIKMTSVVSDNIVAQPKIYKLDVIVPYGAGAILNDSYEFDATTIANVYGTLNRADAISKNYSYTTSVITSVIKTLITTADALGSMQTVAKSTAEVNAKVASITSEPDYNKLSLEYMRDNRSICKFKSWDGWRYRYVAITGLELHKEPTEDGVYEGTITLQEVPILTTLASRGSLLKAKPVSSEAVSIGLQVDSLEGNV